MKIRILRVLLIAVAAATVPMSAVAQSPDDTGKDESVIVHVNRELRIAQGDEIDVGVVVRGNAVVDGIVNDRLVVINGDTVISGTVEGGIVVVRGHVDLRPGARVGDVTLIRSDLTRANDAVVTGSIEERTGFNLGIASAVFSALLWVGFTLALLVAALVFAAVGSHQLVRAGNLLTTSPGWTIGAAAIVWLGLPIVAVILFFTVVGIPLGLGVLIFLLPALWILGYLVVGTTIGRAIFERSRLSGSRPYLPSVVGVLLLQVLALLPFLGGLVALLLGLYGAGGLARLAWSAARGAQPGEARPA